MHLAQLLTRITPKLPLLETSNFPKTLMVDAAVLAPAPKIAKPTTLYLDARVFTLNKTWFAFTTAISPLSVLIEIGDTLMSATKVQLLLMRTVQSGAF